jgi:hypothetical protein
MKNLFLIICSLLPLLSSAQKENDNWYFGDHGAVSFAGTTPVVLNNSQMDVLENCGTASDENGKLLFYTNGVYIWHREHQFMQNGIGLTGDDNTQQLAIIKNPANINQYFVFTTALNSPSPTFPNRIAYSIIDMSMGSIGSDGFPLGKVLDSFKNISLEDNAGNTFVSEAITIVPSTFNKFWVLVPHGNQLYSYLLDNQGFHNGNPVVSNLNFPVSLTPPNHFGIKASPLISNPTNYTNYVCISHWGSGFANKVYSFNNVTGQITNDLTLNINSIEAYTPEFSKNANILYLAYKNVYAVNMATATPSSISILQIPKNNDKPSSLQRNKYGDIYISVQDAYYLGKINNPDIFGPSISLDLTNISLGTHRAKMGLPQLLPRVDAINISTCVPGITLTTPETHWYYTYQAGDYIRTMTNYVVSLRQNITMKAGDHVVLRPNSYIMKGATYFALIDACDPVSKPALTTTEQIALSVDLDKDVTKQDDIIVYPNPASAMIHIDTRQEKLEYWELYDMMGKMVSTGITHKINTEHLSKSNYLLKIITANGKSSYKKVTIQ